MYRESIDVSTDDNSPALSSAASAVRLHVLRLLKDLARKLKEQDGLPGSKT